MRKISTPLLTLVFALGHLCSPLAFAQADEATQSAAAEACQERPQAERARCERKAASDATKARREQARAAAAERAYRLQLAEALARDGAPRDLALAALLRSMARLAQAGDSPVDDAVSEKWRAQAFQNGGNDALTFVLLLMAPSSVEETAGDIRAWRHQALQRWRSNDPENLEPVLRAALRTPPASGNGLDGKASAEPVSAPVLDAAMFPIARSAKRYDTYYDDIARLTLDAVRRHPPTREQRRKMGGMQAAWVEDYAVLMGMNIWSLNMPAIQYLIKSCKGDALTMPQRKEDCRHIGEIMRHRSDTLIARLIGIAVGRYAARDAAEKTAITEERRVVDWQMKQWALAKERDQMGEVGRMRSLILENADISESEIMRRTIEDAGLPMNPPKDWVSSFKFPDERQGN